MLDLFSIYCIIDYRYDSERELFPHFINKDEDNMDVKPYLEPFKRVQSITLNNFATNEAIEALNDVQYLELTIWYLELQFNSCEESELFTDPEYFKKEVNLIDWLFIKSCTITNKFLNNINDIEPKKLILRINEWLIYQFHFISILQNIKSCIALKLIKSSCSNLCKIIFSKSIILI